MVSGWAMKWKNWNRAIGRLPFFLLFLFWASRLPGLVALPLHNDEGLHITRAIEVWHGHPFWAIQDGKIVNHFLIAALFPQQNPIFAARIPTILISMIGLAAGIALAHRLGGRWAGVLAAFLWIVNPYLFFYERMAFSDAQAGAMGVLALYSALRAAESESRQSARRWTLLAGASLTFAALLKVSAIPFAASVGVVLLFMGHAPIRRRIESLALVGAIMMAGFAVPVFYLASRGQGIFDIALGWIGSGSGGDLPLFDNLRRLENIVFGFDAASISLILIALMAIVMLISGGQRVRWMLVAGAIPLLTIVIFGREVMSRHFVVALPMLTVMAGIESANGIRTTRWDMPRTRWIRALGAAALVMLALPFFLTAYRQPDALPLAELMRTQYITEHPSGYGLREAMVDFPNRVEQGVPIVASMFPDSCRRANFYAHEGYTLLCTDAPGIDLIHSILGESGRVYVLTDTSPLIGVDMGIFDDKDIEITHIKAYARPGETDENASVMLYSIAMQP